MIRLIVQVFICSLALLWTSGCFLDHHGHPVIHSDHHDDRHDRGQKKGHGKHDKGNKTFKIMKQKH